MRQTIGVVWGFRNQQLEKVMTARRRNLLSILSGCITAAVLGLPLAGYAQFDVTQPGDLIQLVNGVNDGDGNSGPPPAAEGVEHAIDNVGQKYLNFLDLGSGFTVRPSAGLTLVTALRFYPANDAEERDPASYLFEGLQSTGWTTISTGALALPSDRNSGGTTPLDNLFFQEVSFVNDLAYAEYRVTFPTLKNAAAANSMQIAEVELIGVVVPEPGVLSLVPLAGLGWLARRRWA